LIFIFGITVLLIIASIILLSRKYVLFHSILFWILFSGPPNFRSRDPRASLAGTIDLVIALQIIVWVMAFVWILIHYKYIRLKDIYIWLLLFVGMLFLSAINNLGTLLTLFRSFQIFVLIIFTQVWVNKYGIDESLKNLLYGFLGFGIAIALAGIFQPSLVIIAGRMRGDLLGSVGSISVLSLILLLSTSQIKKKWVFYSFILLLGIELALSKTRSAYIVFLFFIIYLFLFRPQIAGFKNFKYALLLIIPFVFLSELSPLVLKWVVREEISIATLSGRIPLWEYLISTMLSKAPYTGLGFYSASRFYAPKFNPGLGTAHNSFVEILIGGGLIGGILFLIIIFKIFRKAFILLQKQNEKNSYKGYLHLFILLLISTLTISLTSSELIVPNPTSFTFFMSCALVQNLDWNFKKHNHKSPVSKFHTIPVS